MSSWSPGNVSAIMGLLKAGFFTTQVTLDSQAPLVQTESQSKTQRVLGFFWKKVGEPIYHTSPVQNLIGRTTAWAAKTAVAQVRSLATQESHPKIDLLLAALQRLPEKIRQIDESFEDALPAIEQEDVLDEPAQNNLFPLEERRATKVLLDAFLKNPAEYLDYAKEEKGELIQLTPALNLLFSKLSAALENDTIECCEKETLQAIEFISHVQKRQMGWLQKAESLPFEQSFKFFMEQLGFTKVAAAAESKTNHETEAAQRELLKRLTKTEVVAPVPPNLEVELVKKLDEVTDIAIKMVLSQLIFQKTTWKESFNRIYSEARHKSENGEMTFDEAFYKALDDEFFSSAKTGLVNQVLYGFHLRITKRLLGSYINEMMRLFKVDLMKFMRMSPEERIDDVFKVILNPLKSHMTAYYTFNMQLAGRAVDESLDEVNRKHFNALEIDGRTIDGILADFARVLVEKYAPTISWTTGIETTLSDVQDRVIKMTNWQTVHILFTLVKVSAVWSSFLLTGIFEKALDAGIKYKLKVELKNFAKINFFKTGTTEEKTHSRYQHIINRFILEKLSQFNANGTSSKHTPIKLRSSPSTQEEMQGIIDELFRNIPLSTATNSPEALHHYFNSRASEKAKQEAYTFFIGQFSPAVSLELLKGMEHFLYDDKAERKTAGLLSEFVWYAVNNLAKTMTIDAGKIDQIEMNTTETEMQEQLHRAVTTVVKDGVKTALDPSKKYQNKTDATLGDLRKQTETFLTSIQTVTIDNFILKNEEWKKLVKAVIDTDSLFAKTKISKISLAGNTLLTSFNSATKTVSSTMDAIELNRTTKAGLDEQLQVLKSIGEQIKSSTARDKILKLNILSGKTWVSAELKKEISSYKEYLEYFLKTPSDSRVLLLYESRSKNFIEKLEEEQNKLGQLIQSKVTAVGLDIENLKNELNRLMTWKNTINSIVITSSDVTNTLAKIIKISGLPVEQYAVPAVMYCVLELLKFKKKTYHWNGVLSRAVHAYTILPTR